ncbi:ESPR domain-containing protein [Pseudomonas sp. OV226]|uniref:ESPR domain-containing protein n=1 Tax=Pseudomonas sp. OV226 TaxID=2135588 RepID=UPI000D6B2B90
MNRTFRLVWNKSLALWVVASELASAKGKKGCVRSAGVLGGGGRACATDVCGKCQRVDCRNWC